MSIFASTNCSSDSLKDPPIIMKLKKFKIIIVRRDVTEEFNTKGMQNTLLLITLQGFKVTLKVIFRYITRKDTVINFINV